MKGLFALLMITHLVLAGVEAAGDKDSIRINLSRKDNQLNHYGLTFEFEKDPVAKAVEKYKVKLPEPLPAAAQVGYCSSGPLFVVMQKIPGKYAVKLILDRNFNFDLTDEDPLEIAGSEKWEDAPVFKVKRFFAGPPPREEWLPYRIGYEESKDRNGQMRETLFISANYVFIGEFRLAGRDFSIKITDGRLRGSFEMGNLTNTNFEIGAKNGAEKAFYQSFELIPIENNLYVLSNIAADGSWIELKKSDLQQTAIGRPAPDMAMTDTIGKTFKISDYRGKALLLDFWPSWCKPCIAKFPDIKKMVLAYEKKHFAVIGVNLDDEKRAAEAKKVIAEYQLPWRQVVEGKGMMHPVYQVYGRLPEYSMSFPIYVLIDSHGIVHYASNDYLKMEHCLALLFSEKEQNRAALFIPLAEQKAEQSRPHLAIDFSKNIVQAFLMANAVKMPAGLTDQVRVGLMPNGTLVVARPGPTPDKILLTLDVDRDLDLTNEESKEIPILSKTGGDVPEAVEMKLKIRYASGAMRFGSFRFFALPAAGGQPGALPEIRYIGQSGLYRGMFHAGKTTYALEIDDPTGDWIITPEDAGKDEILKLKIKKGEDWVMTYQGIRHIPISGSRYCLRQVWEDGMLAILEKEK